MFKFFFIANLKLILSKIWNIENTDKRLPRGSLIFKTRKAYVFGVWFGVEFFFTLFLLFTNIVSNILLSLKIIFFIIFELEVTFVPSPGGETKYSCVFSAKGINFISLQRKKTWKKKKWCVAMQKWKSMIKMEKYFFIEVFYFVEIIWLMLKKNETKYNNFEHRIKKQK